MSTCDVRFTGFGPSLDCRRDSGEQVGANIAAIAMRDPKEARAMLEAMFNALGHGSQRRELARGLAQLPLPVLIQLAETKDGHALLERSLGELKGGLDDSDNRRAADQVGTALSALRSDLRLILMTGQADHVTPEQVQTWGFHGQMSKPLGARTVAEAVQRVMRSTPSTSNA